MMCQCPSCARFAQTIDQVMNAYGGRVKMVFKNYPLRNHRFSLMAAAVALAADRQGKFWEFHELLFQHYNQLDEQKIYELAAEANLDIPLLRKEVKSRWIMDQIRRDINDGVAAEVRGTPTVFVNGYFLGDKSEKGITDIIEKELEKHPPKL